MSSLLHRLIAYTASVLHPFTIGRSVLAVARGAGLVFSAAHRWTAGWDKPELLEKNATRHADMTKHRSWAVWALVAVWAIYVVGIIQHWGFSRGGVVLAVTHFTALFLIGRREPVLNRVQTARMAGESLILSVIDEITLTAKLRTDGARSKIVHPVARLASGTGYETTVQVDSMANMAVIFDPNKGKKEVAKKLRRGVTCVFVYTVKADASQVRLVVLDADPWDKPPTEHPFVASPQPVNLWTMPVPLGTKPDSTVFSRLLVAEGDGGGALAGGAPRQGKTVFHSNLLVPIMLHPGSNIRMIDGKGVDFPDIERVCATYIGETDLDDRALLALATKCLVGIKTEVLRRRKLLLAEGVGHVTEALCRKYQLQLEWIFIDELAVFTEDMRSIDRKGVDRFLELLQWLVRIGPAFGVYCVLATQRPSDKSVPDSLRSLIIFRTAFYISSYPGSAAILGKSGPANRADWLDPEQKGIGISVGEGQFRSHLVKRPDLAKVADYAAALRASTTGVVYTIDHDWPEPVRSILTVFDAELAVKEMPTWAILKGLAELGMDHSAISLAGELRPFGVSPTNVGPKREKGYLRADLERIPKLPLSSPLTPAQPDDRSGGPADDRSGSDERLDGPEDIAANYGPDDGFGDWT